MARKAIIVGNWKMELSHKAALESLRAIKKLLAEVEVSADVVVCPSFPTLADMHKGLKEYEKIQLGAQHVHWEEKGAFTGSVSVAQLTPYVKWCIVGHSEQRELTAMSEEQVRDTAAALLKHGVSPVVCLGESREEREADKTIAKVTAQMETLLSGMTRASLTKLVVVYEPIWAISGHLQAGTGEMPDPSDVAGVIMLMRKLTALRFDQAAAEKLRIIYGGSVKPDNVDAYVSEPGVDGVLPGSASVHPMQFVEIVKKVQDAQQAA